MKKRMTLVQKQSTYGVKDPAEHAKRQVSELDKTAKKSQEKRKICNEQMNADKKELALLDEQIRAIHHNYDPLCVQLEENVQKRKELIKTLEACQKQEQAVMGDMKMTVVRRNQDDSKFNRRMATEHLRDLRGFGTDPSSTFKQTKRGGGTL